MRNGTWESGCGPVAVGAAGEEECGNGGVERFAAAVTGVFDVDGVVEQCSAVVLGVDVVAEVEVDAQPVEVVGLSMAIWKSPLVAG